MRIIRKEFLFIFMIYFKVGGDEKKKNILLKDIVWFSVKFLKYWLKVCMRDSVENLWFNFGSGRCDNEGIFE